METIDAQGIDSWSRICSDSFVPLRASGDQSFRGRLVHRALGGVGVSRVDCTASTVFRPAPLIAGEPRDDVLLSIQLRGPGRIEQSGRAAQLAPFSGAVYEADRPYRLRFDGTMSEFVLQVPRRSLALGDRELRELTARAIPAGSPGLTVLRHFISGVLAAGDDGEERDADDESAGEIARTAAALLDLTMRPYLSEEARPRMAEHGMLVVVKDFIVSNCTDPQLDVEAIAQRHALSRRSLELLFACEHESPASFLRSRRLELAARLLREEIGGQAKTVTEVAYLSGFGDVNTFIRAFRRVEGVTPDRWRRELAGVGS